VRRVMTPKNGERLDGKHEQGMEDWQVTAALSEALGYPMHYQHASDIMDEVAMLTPTFKGVSFKKLDELGSIQWPCNDEAPVGTPTMHIDEFVRGKGKFFLTEYVATTEKVTPMYPLILTTGRILSQYNVGAQTRRTKNVAWHAEDIVEIHPHDAAERGIHANDWVGIKSRAGETVLRVKITERVQPGVIYTTFHHPESGANVITTDNSDWATNCPEFKVTAVQVSRVNQLSDWQQHYQSFSEAQLAYAGLDAEPAKIE
jgi:formate dehydrogenase major subunit